MLLTPATKEIFADTALGGAWTSRNPPLFIRTGVNGITPGDIGNAIGIVEPSSPNFIGIIGTSPSCGINVSQEVGDKRKSTSPSLVRQSQKLDAVVDGNLPDKLDLTSIFSKVIGDKIFESFSRDLYTCCRMNFTADPVQTQTPTFVDLGISTINSLDEGSGIITSLIESEGLRMVPIGARLITFLVKLQRLD